MRLGTCAAALIVLVLASVSASAAVYEFPVALVEATYTPVAGITTYDVSLSRTFSSIEQVRFRWSGSCEQGVEYIWNGFDYDANPVGGVIYAGLDCGGGGGSANKFAGGLSWRETVPCYGTYDGVLSDTARVWVRMDGTVPELGYPASAQITEFTIIVDGVSNPVPEPAGLLALGSGLLAFAGVLRRRR